MSHYWGLWQKGKPQTSEVRELGLKADVSLCQVQYADKAGPKKLRREISLKPSSESFSVRFIRMKKMTKFSVL